MARRLQLPIVLAAILIAACSAPSATAPATAATTAEASAGASATSAPPVATTPVATLNPSVAPSAGGRIVFTRLDPSTGRHELFSVASDGSDLRSILHDYAIGFGLPRFDPAGTQLAAVSGDKGDGVPQNSGDEQRGFETIIQSDRTAHRHLQPPSTTIRLLCSAWSADGQRLACEGWATGGPGKEGLYTVRTADGGDLQRLTTPPSGIRDIPGDYSADGTKLVFVRATYAVLGLGQIWMCNADGSDAHKITDTLSTYRISWSRDGRWIVGERNGALEVIDLQNLGADPRLVEIPNGKATEPRWSPDGSRIVFVFTKKGTSKPQIATVNADGSGLVLVTSGAVDGSPDWGFPGF